MSSTPRQPVSQIAAKYEDERQRAQEQSQIIHLQGQIDELRRLLKEQNNKYQWAMEQARKIESSVGQMQGLIEQHSDEVTRQTERSRRDIAELRREIAGALVKIDESLAPIREMQLQIQQLAEARKQDRDQVVPWFTRIEEVEQRLLSAQAQIKEGEERQRQLEMQLDRLRDADTMAFQEIRRVGEELQVEKQSLRRQIVEAQQLVSSLDSVLEDHNSRISRISDLQQYIEKFAEVLPPQIEAIDAKFPGIIEEMKRIERVLTEWFMMNQDRLEDLRQTSNEKIEALQEIDEQHLRQTTSWLERIDSWVRELEQRLTRQHTRLTEAQEIHLVRITELERRELQTLSGLANAFRDQVESMKAAHLAMHERQKLGQSSTD